ncbi:hypothetical protein H0H92_006839 [Tricholoma furcatifolium]|nr:hypothetical protein H0H92_006839 [Tricholoma furcatifolium]
MALLKSLRLTLTSIWHRPQIISGDSDNYDKSAKDNCSPPFPVVVVGKPAMENDQKHSYEALEDPYDPDYSEYNAQTIELKPMTISTESSPTSATVLVPIRHPGFRTDNSSKPPNFTSDYSPRRPRFPAFSRKYPIATGFQVPQWTQIFVHILLCIVSYPLLLVVMLIARNKSLFWTRFIVGVGCGLVGHQSERYEEITVKGGTSDADITRAAALVPTFEVGTPLCSYNYSKPDAAEPLQNYALTWTMSSFSAYGGLPSVSSFAWNNYTVFFSETTTSQLLPNGSGLGTFDSATMVPSLQTSSTTGSGSAMPDQINPGSVIRFLDLTLHLARYPKWGIRIQCTKIPDANVNLVPLSQNNITYVFTPRETLESLFASLEMDYPESAMVPFNITQTLLPGDSAPSSLNISDIALGGTGGNGFISVEEVLVRLNTTYAPNGTFAVESSQSVPDAQGNPTRIGYDAAVCVEVFEPWIVNVYNSSTVGQPNSISIVGPGNEVESVNATEKLVGPPLSTTDPNAARQLNSSDMASVYEIAHDNAVNQLLKLVSFSGGDGPYGYTGLSPAFFAQARALSDATNLLPYLAGSGDLLARSYTDRELSSTSINPLFLAIYLTLILLLGLLAGFFVPKLPLNVPHRGFDAYSWIAAFHADELTEVGRTADFERNMELHEIMQQLGDHKFRYHVDRHTGSL